MRENVFMEPREEREGERGEGGVFFDAFVLLYWR